ncbi:MAG: serine protease [Betaproteobacteria bacterium]|nr:serine protease [Betaproteobacteria bacterium]MCC6248783.1 serine protease [Rubrivivax sp.]MCL4698420.1 S1C family serine protease [Burkholderiaceae bacterium]
MPNQPSSDGATPLTSQAATKRLRPPWRSLLALLAGIGLGLGLFAATAPAARAQGGSAVEAQSRALARASEAVVGLRATAVEGARSASTLGREREGSGVVIGGDGLVLTIGYLVLEAERVEIRPDDGRRIPARVVAYDLATGFGLVQALAPLKLEPAPFGTASAATRDEPLMVASGGEAGAVSIARLLSRRAFSGYWEYHIDGALFTAPARRDHSGAGLFNGRGELLGIGSLLVSDAAGPDSQSGTRAAGNMFVPVDLLRPILAELRERGASNASTRAWMGLNCVERDGEVRVMRVTADSPADVAGLQSGDRIMRIDGAAVGGLAQLYQSLWAGGAPERAVRLEILREGKPQDIVVQTVDRAKTLRRAEGV